MTNAQPVEGSIRQRSLEAPDARTRARGVLRTLRPTLAGSHQGGDAVGVVDAQHEQSAVHGLLDGDRKRFNRAEAVFVPMASPMCAAWAVRSAPLVTGALVELPACVVQMPRCAWV